MGDTVLRVKRARYNDRVLLRICVNNIKSERRARAQQQQQHSSSIHSAARVCRRPLARCFCLMTKLYGRARHRRICRRRRRRRRRRRCRVDDKTNDAFRGRACVMLCLRLACLCAHAPNDMEHDFLCCLHFCARARWFFFWSSVSVSGTQLPKVARGPRD